MSSLPNLTSLIIHLNDDAVKMHHDHPAHVQKHVERHITKQGHAKKEHIAFLVDKKNQPVGMMLKCRYGQLTACIDRMDDITKETLRPGAAVHIGRSIMQWLREQGQR